jgi:hypothetical protein
MTYVLSDNTFDRIETIQLEAHNEIIETIATELCGKRVTAPSEMKTIWNGRPVVILDENGPFHIDAIVDYDHELDTVVAEVYDDDIKNRSEVTITTYTQFFKINC